LTGIAIGGPLRTTKGELNMTYKRIAALGLVLLLSTSLAGAQEPDNPRDPELNFEHLWKALDLYYAQFDVKKVDWDALYNVYRPQVTPDVTDDQLLDIMLAMLHHLNDAHVCIDNGSGRICAGLVDELARDDFSLDLVTSTYLKGATSTALGGSFTYGWLTPGIGYLHIADFKDGDEETATAIDEVLEVFATADAMILDVRSNPGGRGRVAELVAGRFADRKRHYMRSQVRYGEGHHDFGPVCYWNVEPLGPVQFTQPTVLLTHRFTESAADEFTLAMRVLPHVTVVGDLTAGAFSSQFPERLPNGWILWLAYCVIRDLNGVCWDGIGVPPDLRIKNTKADIDAGRDRVLDFAIRLLQDGSLQPQDEAGSLVDLRTSIVGEYAENVETHGLESAVASLEKALADDTGEYFLTVAETMQLTQRYLQAEKYDEAIPILKACRERYPRFASTYAMLVKAYLGVGDADAAAAVLAESESVKAIWPFEENMIAEAKAAFLKHERGSAADVIGRAIADGGIEEAREALERLLPPREDGPIFDENDFNRLGYGLVENGDLEAAIFVFETNTRMNPDSWNAYDSLGEALMNAGRKELAIENYQRSLELNPGNKNAKSMLKTLQESN
jgi:carboxyl-terminal processing protease